jgi:hypothetical protein
VPARQAQCQGGPDNPASQTEKSGSPSYQAAQNYDSYDCFAAGCHSGYGDIVPHLSPDESNVRLEGEPPEPENFDANLPGDEPSSREIPARTTEAPQSPPAHDGFVRGEEASQAIPPRGYFSPGYPHPGYMHPSYGYSYTEVDGARFGAEELAEITEQQAADEAAAEEALIAEAVVPSADPHATSVGDSPIEEALAEEGFEDSVASEVLQEEPLEEEGWAEATLEEEPVARTATEDLSQEYTRYDDTYGFDSEWYGPYDATKVDPQPVAESQAANEVAMPASLPADYTLTSQYEDLIAEVDPAPAIESDSKPLVDYGPAELEVDVATVVKSSADDEDAAFEAAIHETHEDGFNPETQGSEKFQSNEYVTKPGSTEKLPSIDKEISDASRTFPWDYVYRLELGDLNADAPRIPYAPGKQAPNMAVEDARSVKLASEAYGLEDAAPAAENDPALPAGADFDPAALISRAERRLGQFDGRKLLIDTAWLSRTLTPMELTRLLLAATPVAERESITVLIPQPKVVDIQPLKPEMDSDEALRELALMLDDAGRALQMLSRHVESFAAAGSPATATGEITPLQSRIPAESETR